MSHQTQSSGIISVSVGALGPCLSILYPMHTTLLQAGRKFHFPRTPGEEDMKKKKEQLLWGGTKSSPSPVAGVGVKDSGDKETSFFSPLEKGAMERRLQPKRFICPRDVVEGTTLNRDPDCILYIQDPIPVLSSP